ncbi:MAG: hypothetical protein ACF8XB_07725 [Planctomycetota bacterium JB042]
MTILNANLYSATTQLIDDAIETSRRQNEIVRVSCPAGDGQREGIIAALLQESEGEARNTAAGVYEFWGECDTGDDAPTTWRVHVILD